MKLVHYAKNGNIRVGLVKEELIFDVCSAAKKLDIQNLDAVNTIDEILARDLLEQLKSLAAQLTREFDSTEIRSVKLWSPILNPEKIYLAAVNYLSHSEEQRIKPPPYPYFFTKFKNALIGPDDPVVIPRVSKKVDWEAELAVIIGKRGKNISREDAMSFVAGYSVANDISFRDFQMNENVSPRPPNLDRNWVKGKGMDSSFPLGPSLVTSDELRNPYECGISLYVNGEKRQDSIVGEIVYKIDELIEYLSAGVTLLPGDIISTGTPMGVAYFTGVPFLKNGDVLEAKIDRIGVLRNPVVSED